MGNLESAKEKFNRIGELSPDFAPAIHYLGEMALNRGDIPRAMELFEDAIRKDYKTPAARYRLAQCAMLAGDTEAAKEYLQKELDLEPEDTDVLLSMGSMLLSLGEIDAALNCFLQVIDNDEDNAQAYHYLALIAAIRKEYANAQDFFELAIKANPESPDTLRDAAKFFLLMGDARVAYKYAAKARQLSGDDHEIVRLCRQIRHEHFANNMRHWLSSTWKQLRLPSP